MANRKAAKRHVVITTQYRGTYFGELVEHDKSERWCILDNARMVIYWGTTNGVDQLAHSGPTDKSKLGDPASNVWLPGLTSMVDAKPEAVAAWGKR